VQAYIDRAKAYNGTCTALVTLDGAPVSSSDGCGARRCTTQVSNRHCTGVGIFPNVQEYTGLPFELGRIGADDFRPGVQQQFGMRVGIPNAGQLNALETLNIRGERSVTCKGTSTGAIRGPLPPGAPAVCEEFRKQPDALERARSWTSSTHEGRIWRSCRCTARCSP